MRTEHNKYFHIDNGVLTWVSREITGEFVIPEGASTIEEKAFSGCIKLERIVIPESVFFCKEENNL